MWFHIPIKNISSAISQKTKLTFLFLKKNKNLATDKYVNSFYLPESVYDIQKAHSVASIKHNFLQH